VSFDQPWRTTVFLSCVSFRRSSTIGAAKSMRKWYYSQIFPWPEGFDCIGILKHGFGGASWYSTVSSLVGFERQPHQKDSWQFLFPDDATNVAVAAQASKACHFTPSIIWTFSKQIRYIAGRIMNTQSFTFGRQGWKHLRRSNVA
jgi:hypothetical protein